MNPPVKNRIVGPEPLAAGLSTDIASRLRACRVLIAGLGNIGSFLALLLGPLVGYIRLVDRDRIESHNTANQLYGPESVGCAKVDAMAQLLTERAPGLELQPQAVDLEDLPWGEFSDVDVAFGGLDSLRARQVVSEKTFALGIPYIDGGVGEGLLARVQVLLPGQACLECGWSTRHYRQLATEVRCFDGKTQGARTVSPACAGAAVAGLMVAQLVRFVSDHPPTESYEISGDLLSGKFVSSRLRRNYVCRFDHGTSPIVLGLGRDFAQATLADIAALLRRRFGELNLRLEVRRGVFDEPLFASSGHVGIQQLIELGPRRLADTGLTPRDRIVVRGPGVSVTHLRLDLEDDGLST